MSAQRPGGAGAQSPGQAGPRGCPSRPGTAAAWLGARSARQIGTVLFTDRGFTRGRRPPGALGRPAPGTTVIPGPADQSARPPRQPGRAGRHRQDHLAAAFASGWATDRLDLLVWLSPEG